jgi:c-di-GMP-binding flagellar brake protein YcgR
MLNENVFDLIRECADKKTSIFFSAQGIEVVFQTQILVIREDSLVIANSVPPQFITNVVKAPKYFVQIQMIRFVSEEIHSDGVNIVFPLKSLKPIEDNRGAKRFLFNADEKVVLEVINPFDHETTLRKSVIDISSTGMSIRSPVNSRLYEPGTHFKNMKVLINGQLYNESHGTVIYKRMFLDQEGNSYYQVGFKFENSELSK